MLVPVMSPSQTFPYCIAFVSFHILSYPCILCLVLFLAYPFLSVFFVCSFSCLLLLCTSKSFLSIGHHFRPSKTAVSTRWANKEGNIFKTSTYLLIN